jgi:hypothetical protein
MATVGEGYPGIQISRENFADILRAIVQLVDELPEEGFTPSLVDPFWAKGADIMVCQDEETRDWLAARVPTLVAWEGFRLKMVGLDALPTYKRVVTWILGPVEDLEYYFQWLHRMIQGLDTTHWTVYEHREEPNGVRLVLSIDTTFVTALEGMGWRPFSGVRQAILSLLVVKPEGKK